MSENMPTDTGAVPPPVILLQMITGYRVSQAIYAGAKLGIADLLHNGPKSSAELAQRTGTDARSLARLLRALASVGVFAEVAEHRGDVEPAVGEQRADHPPDPRLHLEAGDERLEWRRARASAPPRGRARRAGPMP